MTDQERTEREENRAHIVKDWNGRKTVYRVEGQSNSGGDDVLGGWRESPEAAWEAARKASEESGS